MAEQQDAAKEPMTEREALASIASSLSGIRIELREISGQLHDIRAKVSGDSRLIANLTRPS